jgi:sulfite exporter TauE/SafE
MNTLVTALATGLLGSLHCAVMCGPLVTAGCSGRRGALGPYVLGRLVSYATVGAVLGHLGHEALMRVPLATMETMAVLLVAGYAATRGLRLLCRRASVAGGPGSPGGTGGARLVPLRPRPGARPGGSYGAWLASLLPRSGLGLGLVTGVLPCGLLVSAWLLAMATGQALGGALVMTAFAMASAPGLLLPWYGQKLLARRGLHLSARAQGVAWLLLALWIAARPLFAAAHCHS